VEFGRALECGGRHCWRCSCRNTGLDRLLFHRRTLYETHCDLPLIDECWHACSFRDQSLEAANIVVTSVLSIFGVVGIGIGGWLGGEMVYVKGMAVEAVEKLAKKAEEQPRLRRVS
jgi:hypothetical protein